MQLEFFIQGATGQAGPYTAEQLRSFDLKADTPIWYEGMDDWGVVSDLEQVLDRELKSAFAPIAQQEAIKKSIDSKKKKVYFISGGLLLLFVIILIVSTTSSNTSANRRNYNNSTGSSSSNSAAYLERRKKMVRDNLNDYLWLETNSYTYSDLGGISNLRIKLSNKCEFSFNRVVGKLTYIKANGGVWKSIKVQFNDVDDYQILEKRIPDTHRCTSVKISFESASSTQLGI